VRMKVGGLTLDPVTKTPVVVLRDESDDLNLPIWIGLLEATSMATELEGIKMARPMTHDLLKRMIEELGANVDCVEVTALRENTFYATIRLTRGDTQMTLDSRPSDAICLALRLGSPIYVAQAVLDATMAAGEDAASNGSDSSRPGRDISDVSPEDWNEILQKLDPDDFKYKM